MYCVVIDLDYIEQFQLHKDENFLNENAVKIHLMYFIK